MTSKDFNLGFYGYYVIQILQMLPNKVVKPHNGPSVYNG